MKAQADGHRRRSRLAGIIRQTELHQDFLSASARAQTFCESRKGVNSNTQESSIFAPLATKTSSQHVTAMMRIC
jgi:hypothetical protein